MHKFILVAAAMVIVGSVPNMYGMDLEPVVRVGLQDNGQDGVQRDLVRDNPEQESRAVQLASEKQENLLDIFQENYQGDAESRREFYKTKFRERKPEGLENERRLCPHQALLCEEQEAGDAEDKVQAEQVKANQEQEHSIPERAGFRFQMRQMDGLPGVAIKSVNGKQIFAPFSDRGERGVAHVMGGEHFFPLGQGQDIMHRMDMEPFYAAPSITQERGRYIPRNGSPQEMTRYLLSSQIISKQ